MPTVALRDVYVAELSELHDAEQQLLRELPLLSASATSQPLRNALDEHYRETQRHLERVEQLFQQLDERPRQQVSRPVRAIVEEARMRNATIEAGDLLDAALASTARRIEHYEIAVYGSALAFAEMVGDSDGARLLQQTLDEENRMDERLSRLMRDTHRERTSARGDIGQAPVSLMPGVWETETTGFASVPPRAASDIRPASDAGRPPAGPARAESTAEAYPENELMVARGEPSERAADAMADRKPRE